MAKQKWHSQQSYPFGDEACCFGPHHSAGVPCRGLQVDPDEHKDEVAFREVFFSLRRAKLSEMILVAIPH